MKLEPLAIVNDTQYVSAVIEERLDFARSPCFAPPQPTNGILNAGDDIKVSFNEAIYYNSAISQIEISMQSLPIDDNVSLQFMEQRVLLLSEKPDISSSDIITEWWMLNKTPLNTAGLLKQAKNLEIGLTAFKQNLF
jgi:hypothetical protein